MRHPRMTVGPTKPGRGVRTARRQLLLLRVALILLTSGHDAEVVGRALSRSVGTHGIGVGLHVLHLHLALMLLHHHHLLHFGGHLMTRVRSALAHLTRRHPATVHAHRGVYGMHAGHGDRSRVAGRRAHGGGGTVRADLGHHLLRLLSLHVHVVMVRHHARLALLERKKRGVMNSTVVEYQATVFW